MHRYICLFFSGGRRGVVLAAASWHDLFFLIIPSSCSEAPAPEDRVHQHTAVYRCVIYSVMWFYMNGIWFLCAFATNPPSTAAVLLPKCAHIVSFSPSHVLLLPLPRSLRAACSVIERCMIFTWHKVNSSYTCPVGAASCTVILCLSVCVCVCQGEGQLREGGYSPRPEPTAASAADPLQPGRAVPWLQKRHHRSLSGVAGGLSTNPRDEHLDNFRERHSHVSFIHHPAQLSGMSPPPPAHPPARFDCHMYACFWKVCLRIAAALRVTACPEALYAW